MRGIKMKGQKMRVVVALSGGMDSATLVAYLKRKGHDVYPVSFNYGQKHSIELKQAEAVVKHLGLQDKWKLFDLNVLNEMAPSALTRKDIEVPEGAYNEESMKATVVPARNLVILSLLTSYAIGVEADAIALGNHAGDHDIYPDCRPEFIKAVKRAIALSDYKAIKVIAPFNRMDKGDIAKIGKRVRLPYDLTWTCYKGGETPCGVCGSCDERKKAFEKAGYDDKGVNLLVKDGVIIYPVVNTRELKQRMKAGFKALRLVAESENTTKFISKYNKRNYGVFAGDPNILIVPENVKMFKVDEKRYLHILTSEPLSEFLTLKDEVETMFAVQKRTKVLTNGLIIYKYKLNKFAPSIITEEIIFG